MLRRLLLVWTLVIPASSLAETGTTAFFENAFCSGFYGGIASLSLGHKTFLGDVSFPTSKELLTASKDAKAAIVFAKDTGMIDGDLFKRLVAITVAGIDNSSQIKRSIRSEDELYRKFAKQHLKSTSELCDGVLSDQNLAIAPKIGW
ncbi:hypothetical protein [Aliiroseovarius sp. 2305UL8-7]|uniref:hypothetical protein n=1 Tax=Aliiroseovarius conchicola TaxID=3121637 RepID=UPI003529B007